MGRIKQINIKNKTYYFFNYLLVHRIDDFIEEKQESKYLDIASTDSNSEVLKKYAEVWSGIKDQIEKINGSKSGEYGKEYMKIRFN